MSNYAILFTKSARKQLESLPLEICDRIEQKVGDLALIPRPVGCRKLKGSKNRWRIRVGDYRIIYTIDDNNRIIDILTVGHRREIYD